VASKTVLVDDIDGSERDVRTVRITVEGTQYSLDLGPKSRRELNAVLKPFLAKARVRPKDGESLAAHIRAWAADNNVAVPARGKIPVAVQAQYEEAQRG
jgi:hypothetical protein